MVQIHVRPKSCSSLLKINLRPDGFYQLDEEVEAVDPRMPKTYRFWHRTWKKGTTIFMRTTPCPQPGPFRYRVSLRLHYERSVWLHVFVAEDGRCTHQNEMRLLWPRLRPSRVTAPTPHLKIA